MSAAAAPEVARPGKVSIMTTRLDVRHLITTGADKHPSLANGVHNVARQIAREQIAAGYRARITFVSAVPVLGAGDCELPTEVVPASGVTVFGRVVRLQSKIIRTLLADAGPQTLFHIHGGREPLLVDLAFRLHRRGIPYVVTVHGRYSHVYDQSDHCQRRVTALYLTKVERSLLVKARFVQGVSLHEKRVLQRIAPGARIEAIGHGAYSSRFDGVPPRPKARTRSSSFPRFAYCGRYAVWHKGLDLLLKGFAEYRRHGGHGSLTMIGSGDREPLMRLIRALDIGDAVEVRGPLFGNDRDLTLGDCDFFVVASRFDAGPLTALESALLGLPLLVTPNTAVSEVVASRGAGISIADLTPEAVFAAMREADRLTHREWCRHSAAAYQLAVSEGDWTRIAARLLELYQ